MMRQNEATKDLHTAFDVVHQKRTVPSSYSHLVPVPQLASSRDVEGYVNDCLNVYTRDWKIVKHTSGESDCDSKSRIGPLTPRGSNLASASFSDSNTSLDFSSPELREQTGIFSLYRTRPSADKSIGRIYTIESPFQEKPSIAVSVELRGVRLSAAPGGSGTPRGSSIKEGPPPINEPLFSSLTLVDIKHKERRSESYFFIHNPESVPDMVVAQPLAPTGEERPTSGPTPHVPLSQVNRSTSSGNILAASSPGAKKPPLRAPPATPTRLSPILSAASSPDVTAPGPRFVNDLPGGVSPLKPPITPPNRVQRFDRQASSTNVDSSAAGPGSKAACMFSIEDAHPGLYIIIRVGRLLRNESEKAKDKESELTVKEFEELCSSPLQSKYIQQCAWGAIPLFQDASGSTLGMATNLSGSVGSGMKWHTGREDMPCSLYSITQPLSDEAIFQLLSNERELKRLKTLPSDCYISIRRFADDIRGKVPEIQSFFPKQNAVLHYVNLLYLYPITVKIPKLKNPNIAIRFRLKDDDSDPNAEGLLSFYTRGSGVPNESSATTSVCFHEKHPFFTDELKAQLPVNLNKRHHLLITYYNVAPKKDPQVLGYSVVPLLKNSRLLKDGDVTVPITTQLPANYFRPDANIKHFDPKKSFCHFRVRTHSSIHPPDDKLHDFFQNYTFENSAPIVAGLRQANHTIMINFFPVIFDQLLRIISSPFEAPSKEAFLTLLSLLTSPSNNQLLSYIEYLFDNPKPSNKFIHEEICRLWVAFLSEEKLHPIVERFPNSLNWFLLVLIRKSMMMTVRERPDTLFPADFQKNLQKLMGLIVQGSRCSTLDQTISVAMFLKDMLYVLESQFVYDLIEMCVAGFQRQEGNPMSQMLKLTFIRVVTEHEGYLPLMIPDLCQEVHEGKDPNFKKRHFLTALLLNEVHGGLISGDTNRRRQAIETLRDILRKHTLDRRFSPSHKEHIAALYFYVITIMTENFMTLKTVLDSPPDEPAAWLVIAMHLVKDCDRRLLRTWWASKAQKIHLAFLALLDYALTALDDPQLSVLSNFTVLDIVDSFIYDYAGSEGDQEVNPLVEKFFDLLQKMMLSNNEPFLISLYATLEKIVNSYGRIIFSVANTPFCEKLCFDVLRHCKGSLPAIRSKASKFFYTLIQMNRREAGNIHRMKLQSTVAIAKLVGMDQSKHDNAFFDSLEESLKDIGKHATSPGADPTISNDAVQLTNNLMAIVRQSKKISENSQDPEMVEDLYYDISRSYVNSPDLQVAWLESLAVIHESHKSWVEAAQCKIFIASLVFQYLKSGGNKMFRRMNLEDIAEVAPNILREPELNEEARAEGSEAFQSEVWTIAGFFDLLKEASNLLEQEELFELSIEIYELIAPAHRMDKNFIEMHFSYQKMQDLCNKLIETEKKAKDRLFPSYFRVAFYGEKFGELAGKEFIYKEKPRTVLGNITERIKQQLSAQHPGVPVVVLPNSKELPQLKPDTLYIQVANVKTYDDPLEERVTEFDRHFNVRRFIFEMGFTTEGKGQSDDLSKQQKKKIIFTTQYSFPDIKKRQIVIDKEEIILTPIENALELISDKIKAIREILEISPPNKNKLQQLLTGTVMTMVNAGPVALCESFLAKEHVTNFSLEHVKELRKRMDYFVLLCAFAVKLHKGVVGSEQQQLHQQYELKFDTLKSKIKQYTSLELDESKFAPPASSATASTSPSRTTPATPSLAVTATSTSSSPGVLRRNTAGASSQTSQPVENFSAVMASLNNKLQSNQNQPLVGASPSVSRISGANLRALAAGIEPEFDLDRKVRNSTMRVKERRATGVFSLAMFMNLDEETHLEAENVSAASVPGVAESLSADSMTLASLSAPTTPPQPEKLNPQQQPQQQQRPPIPARRSNSGVYPAQQ